MYRSLARAPARPSARGLPRSIPEPRLDLDFLAGSLPAAATLTRASAARAYNSSGVLASLAIDAPRFDHDPVTHAPRGLLLEPAATNLLLRSAEFDNAVWTTWNGATPVVTANTAVAPDGTTTADSILFNTAEWEWRAQSATIADDGATLTASVYYKAGTAASWQLQVNLTGGTSTVGSSTLVASDGSVLFTTHGGTSTAIGGGWFRVAAFAPNNASGNTTAEVGVQQNGAVTGTVTVWGAMLEVGGAPTSYIATAGSTVTRAADVCSVPLGGWFSAAAGTFVADAVLLGSVVSRFIATASDDTADEAISLQTSAAGLPRISVTDGGVSQAAPACGYAAVAGTPFRAAGAYAANDFAIAAGGNAGLGLDTGGTLPTVDRIYLGASGVGAQTSAIHLRQLRYWPARLSDVQLQTLVA